MINTEKAMYQTERLINELNRTTKVLNRLMATKAELTGLFIILQKKMVQEWGITEADLARARRSMEAAVAKPSA